MGEVPEQFLKNQGPPADEAGEQVEAPAEEAPAEETPAKEAPVEKASTLDAAGVRALMTSYGSGETSVEDTATQLWPLYQEATSLHSGRAGTEDSDPDAASDPDAFIEVAVARQTGTITGEQYVDLGNALIRGKQ